VFDFHIYVTPCTVGLSDFIDTFIDILFPDKVSIFQPRVSIFLFYFLANFIEKSDVTISENTEH